MGQEKEQEQIKAGVDVKLPRIQVKAESSEWRKSKMVKSFFIGILVAIIFAGLLWWFTGRNDIEQIRSDYNRTANDLERVQQNIRKLTINADGFARDITTIDSTAKRVGDRSGRLESGLQNINGNFRDVIAKVDELEKWNRRSIVLNRDYGDQLYNLRQLNKESGVQK